MSERAPTSTEEDDAASEAAPRGLTETIRRHPWITLIMVSCTVGGAIFGPLAFDESWSLARQIAAGAFLGAWIGLTITVTKMIG